MQYTTSMVIPLLLIDDLILRNKKYVSIVFIVIVVLLTQRALVKFNGFHTIKTVPGPTQTTRHTRLNGLLIYKKFYYCILNLHLDPHRQV